MRENGGAQFRTRWTKKRLSSGVSAKSGEEDLFTNFSNEPPNSCKKIQFC